MKCDRCGADVTETLLLCPTCGNILHKEEKEEKKSAPPNPFCTGGEAPKEEKKVEQVYQPQKLNKSTLDLLFSVEYHLANFIYIAIITAIVVITSKFPSLIPLPGFNGILTVIAGLMMGNIALGLFLEPFFYKMDVDFWVALIPFVNVFVYLSQGLKGEGDLIKKAIYCTLGTYAIGFVGNLPGANAVAFISMVLGVVQLIVGILAIVYGLEMTIKVSINYAYRFGFTSLPEKILWVLFPYLMMLIVIFDKNRQYTY